MHNGPSSQAPGAEEQAEVQEGVRITRKGRDILAKKIEGQISSGQDDKTQMARKCIDYCTGGCEGCAPAEFAKLTKAEFIAELKELGISEHAIESMLLKSPDNLFKPENNNTLQPQKWNHILDSTNQNFAIQNNLLQQTQNKQVTNYQQTPQQNQQEQQSHQHQERQNQENRDRTNRDHSPREHVTERRTSREDRQGDERTRPTREKEAQPVDAQVEKGFEIRQRLERERLIAELKQKNEGLSNALNHQREVLWREMSKDKAFGANIHVNGKEAPIIPARNGARPTLTRSRVRSSAVTPRGKGGVRATRPQRRVRTSTRISAPRAGSTTRAMRPPSLRTPRAITTSPLNKATRFTQTNIARQTSNHVNAQARRFGSDQTLRTTTRPGSVQPQTNRVTSQRAQTASPIQTQSTSRIQRAVPQVRQSGLQARQSAPVQHRVLSTSPQRPLAPRIGTERKLANTASPRTEITRPAARYHPQNRPPQHRHTQVRQLQSKNLQNRMPVQRRLQGPATTIRLRTQNAVQRLKSTFSRTLGSQRDQRNVKTQALMRRMVRIDQRLGQRLPPKVAAQLRQLRAAIARRLTARPNQKQANTNVRHNGLRNLRSLQRAPVLRRRTLSPKAQKVVREKLHQRLRIRALERRATPEKTRHFRSQDRAPLRRRTLSPQAQRVVREKLHQRLRIRAQTRRTTTPDRKEVRVSRNQRNAVRTNNRTIIGRQVQTRARVRTLQPIQRRTISQNAMKVARARLSNRLQMRAAQRAKVSPRTSSIQTRVAQRRLNANRVTRPAHQRVQQRKAQHRTPLQKQRLQPRTTQKVDTLRKPQRSLKATPQQKVKTPVQLRDKKQSLNAERKPIRQLRNPQQKRVIAPVSTKDIKTKVQTKQAVQNRKARDLRNQQNDQRIREELTRYASEEITESVLKSLGLGSDQLRSLSKSQRKRLRTALSILEQEKQLLKKMKSQSTDTSTTPLDNVQDGNKQEAETKTEKTAPPKEEKKVTAPNVSAAQDAPADHLSTVMMRQNDDKPEDSEIH